MNIYTFEKRSRCFLSMLNEVGVTKCIEVVSTQEPEVLAIMKGVQKVSTLQKSGRRTHKVVPCLERGHAIFHIL